MQKYAFLVTAHTDIEQLKRLSKRLMSLGDIYLLIDKKQKDENYLTEVQKLVSNSGGGNLLGPTSHKHCVGRVFRMRRATDFA